ncbi:MAG: hypothetical protein NC305_15865 [Lachnospiraceae bacterium]|nr:hypothetical protein [Muribaculaceae bacterium]MCM1412004.1 hypothetical protein [Lachnospiraceae bacterium]
MKQEYIGRYHKSEIKHAFLTGIISIVIFIVTAFGASALFKKSANDIGDNYETVRVKAIEKIERRPVRSSTKYYIRGVAEDGYEGIFWVPGELYKEIETGDFFNVYKYKDCYGSTLDSLIEENAGAVYLILELTAIMALPAGVIFVGIGIVQKIKGRRKS